VARDISRSFTSGELTPALRVRADLSKYASGLSKCSNFLIKAQGGVYSRSGLRYVCELIDSTARGRLLPFSFNTEQTYVLVFEDLKMRVIKDGGLIVDGAGPAYFELTTPYTTAQLPRLGFTQSADVLTITHPDHDPRNINRLADDNWTITTISFAPTTDSPASLVLTATGTGGGTYSKVYEYVVTAVGADGSESIASTKASITTNSLSVTYGVECTWAAVAGAEYYKVYKTDSVNTSVYGFIGESKALQYSDFNIAPDTSLSPPEARTPFAGAGNKPSSVNYYQQRQIFGNSLNGPQTLWATQTANYASLRTSSPARADDAVTMTIAARQVNEIRHIVSLDSLILMTSGGEWLITEGQTEVFSPDTVGAKIQSYNGSSWVPPAIINDSVIYVQEKGSRIRDLGYTFSSDKYQGNDLSIMSEHFFDGYEIEEMTYSSEPYGILWCIRNDGQLLGMTYQREHEVWGWHKHSTQGLFESVTSVGEGQRDAPYFIVNRTINGVTKRFVERMEVREETNSEDCFYVDSGLSYSGEAISTLTGLDHLDGEEVTVLADGNVVKGLVPVAGSITLPRAASKVHAGLAYECEINTMAIDTLGSGKSSAMTRGHKKSVSEVTLVVNSSRGGWMGSVTATDDELQEFKPRFTADGYDTIALRSYDMKINASPEWNEGGQIRIVQRDPLPLSILAIIPEVDIGG
jgi:hypothetical protein